MNKFLFNNGKFDFQKLSDLLINLGLVMSIISFLMIYISRKNLPSGVCPIDENRTILYLSIGISLVGLLLSFKGKKNKI